MAVQLIGDKTIFAVEFQQYDGDERMGYAKIWFGGKPLGTNEDLIFKSYLIQGLEDLLLSTPLVSNSEMNPKNLFHYLSININRTDSFRHLGRSFGTFCDDFTIFSHSSGNDIHVLWKLHNASTPFSDLNKLSQDVHHFVINKNALANLVEAVIKVINYR